MSALSTSYSDILIETPENIAFRYELAGPGSRMVAYLIDFIIMMFALAAVNGVIAIIIAESGAFGTRGGESVMDVLLAIAGAFSALFFALSGYFIVSEAVMQGQSPGKRVMGLRVLQENGTPVTILQILLRNLFRLVDCMVPFQYSFGVFVLIFSERTQRVGDLVAGTIVVKEKKPETAKRFRWRPRPVVGRAANQLDLSREEFNFIIEYVGLFKTLSTGNRNRISEKVIRAINLRNDLDKDDFFGPMMQELNATRKMEKFRPAEKIMKEILRFYLTEES